MHRGSGAELFPRGPGEGPPRAAAAGDEDGEEAAGTWVLPMGQGTRMRAQRVPGVSAMGRSGAGGEDRAGREAWGKFFNCRAAVFYLPAPAALKTTQGLWPSCQP